MAAPAAPRKVKLIAGLLAGSAELLDCAAERLAAAWGPIDLVSETLDFTFTDYYRREMGPNLKRRFLAFGNLVAPDALAGAKLLANAVEAEFQIPPAPVERPVNIDPGLIDTARLVLASCKDFSHRVYLRDGVYAEVTLQYRHGGWVSAPWTFPDFASGAYDAFLNAARETYKRQIGRRP